MKPVANTLVENALDAFRKTTRMDAKVMYGKTRKGPSGDILLRITHEGAQRDFEAVIKPRVNRATIALLMPEFKAAENRLLVAEYVNPAIAEVMRDQGIAFIDAAGNAFIGAGPLYIFVKGQKPGKTAKAQPVKRLFKPSGLKLIFALLSNPGLEQGTYREMATAAKVALGTVDFAINELKELDFLVVKGNAGRQLINAERLMKRWIEVYPENLRPKLIQERFYVRFPNWWKGIEPAAFGFLWGGETAAAELTGYLKPERHTIYTDHLPEKFIYQLKLKQDAKGNLEVLMPFWGFRGALAANGLVPPLLIYADLVATGDARAMEAAEIIYEKYIERLVRQDR